MYLSNDQIHALDVPVKDFEVALRSLVSDTMLSTFPTVDSFRAALGSVTAGSQHVLSGKISQKIDKHRANYQATFAWLVKCRNSYLGSTFNDGVPYVSELIDLVFIFFNTAFASLNFAKKFDSVEHFYYSCTQYHKVRNSLSHPASSQISESEAISVVQFVENLCSAIDDKFFWYQPKTTIISSILKFRTLGQKNAFTVSNLTRSSRDHSTLYSRDSFVEALFSNIAGKGERKRLAGSLVLFGYGGVGKTAIVNEFLLRLEKDKRDGLYQDIDFVLFYSSKDEYLRNNQTSGALYIDQTKRDFSTLDDLVALIKKDLKVSGMEEIETKYTRGIVVVDNLENLADDVQVAVIEFTKSVSRSLQFVITSRNEERCEEKIHVTDFVEKDAFRNFLDGLTEDINLALEIDDGVSERIHKATLGNPLVVTQLLNIVSSGTQDLDSSIRAIDNINARNSEVIANFMFKNTFDAAIRELEAKGLPAKLVLQLFSLYDEPLELYSIGKLANMRISDAELLCETLLSRIVVVRRSEYYEMNEFARRYIYIRLLTDRIERANLLSKIKNHKEAVQDKLDRLGKILDDDSNLKRIVDEWQPLNYIDKMVISDLFLIYNDANRFCIENNRSAFEHKLKEINDCVAISNHPYVSFQKARVLKLGLDRFYIRDVSTIERINQSYEMAVESILFDYRYLVGSHAHTSLLVMFGIFLVLHRAEFSRAISLLEEAQTNLGDKSPDKIWFLCHNYLAEAYLQQFEKVKSDAYKAGLKRTVARTIAREVDLTRINIRIDKFRRRFVAFF